MNTLIISTFSCTFEEFKNDAEIVMAAELIDNYLLDKRFMRELEDEEYDAA